MAINHPNGLISLKQTVKQAVQGFSVLSRNATSKCYITWCFMGMCKYTPLRWAATARLANLPWREFYTQPYRHGPHLHTEGNTKTRLLYKNNHLHRAGWLQNVLPLLPLSATVANDRLVPGTVPHHPFSSLIAFFCSWGRIVKPRTCRCGWGCSFYIRKSSGGVSMPAMVASHQLRNLLRSSTDSPVLTQHDRDCQLPQTSWSNWQASKGLSYLWLGFHSLTFHLWNCDFWLLDHLWLSELTLPTLGVKSDEFAWVLESCSFASNFSPGVLLSKTSLSQIQASSGLSEHDLASSLAWLRQWR